MHDFNKTSLIDFFQAQMQGDLFALSAKKGLDSEKFIKSYMNSQIVKRFDSLYDRAQWNGEYYLMDELQKEYPDIPNGAAWDIDAMYWIGYIYRYWHCLTNTKSREIYEIADAPKMLAEYPAGHTMSEENCIGKLLDDMKIIDRSSLQSGVHM